MQPLQVIANPSGGVVSAGQATITSDGSTLRVDQQSDRAIIDWRNFDVAPNEQTIFQQPNVNAITLNRVNGATASHIDGMLSANGNLVIVNPNGVVFGRGARVDVNSLLATTADIANEKFMAGGKLEFDKPGNPDASIVNEGTITAKEAGLVGFVAPRVENRGVITARMGRVQLASGDTATVDFYGDGLLEVAVSDKVSKQLVTNTGEIAADGGLVAMTAATGKNIVDSVINGQGSIHAKTVSSTQTGKILIAGNKMTDVIIDGLIDASGLGAAQTGGAIHILGNRIALLNNSNVSVAGTVGGGEILVGGDYHGGLYRGTLALPQSAVEWGTTPGGYSAVNGSPTAAFFAAYYTALSKEGGVPTASRVFVDKGVVLMAGSTSGNAGRVTTWSNNGTAFYGQANVTATSATGSGGFVEVSGRDWLSYDGKVDSKAASGHNGMLLLDPADITISNAVDSVITASSPFQSTGGGTSNLNVTTLENALASGAVTISSSAGASGAGDITFVDAVSWNSANALTITASNNIIINNTIANAGSGDINMTATVAGTGSIAFNGSISTGGSITALAAGDLTVAGGTTLTTGSTGALSLRAANGVITNTGNLVLNGNLVVGSGNLTLLSGINGTRPSLTLNNLTQLGATVGVVSITGFQDVTIGSNITSSGNITISPQRDFTLNASKTLASNGGTISILSQRDLTTAAGSTISTGAAGTLSLQAANGSIGGTGNLTINGNLSVGTGALTLLSGVNGTRPSLTLSSTTFTQLGATVGVVSITGLQDVTLSTSMTSSGNITISPQRDFIVASTGALSSNNGTILVVAQRDITINASGIINTGASGALTLQAANSSIAGTGNLNLNGKISVGTGALTLLSGINGTRPNLILSSSTFAMLGATVGAISITGFQDVTVSTNITGSSNITISPQRDFVLSASTTLASNAGTIAIVAQRDITTNASSTISTGATGALTLQAANNVVTGTGNLTLGGNISVGTGALTLLSGINGTRPSWTLNSTSFTKLGATVGVINIQGFQDFTLASNLPSSGNITIITQRDLTTNVATTLTTGSASNLVLQAANNVVTGTGNLTLGGNISMGSGALTLVSGINGTRPSYTWNGAITAQSTIGTISITGFQDFTVASNMVSSGSITIVTQRDLTLNSSTNITTGAAGALTLQAANNVVAGTGNLTLNGKISVGTGVLTLTSGINVTRPSWTASSTTFAQIGATVGVVTINGFQDVTYSTNMTSSGSITINPQRDFSLSSGITITSGSAGTLTILAQRDLITAATSLLATASNGSMSLRAANAVITGTGNLTLGGKISVGTGTLTLLSGINGTRPSWTMDSTSFAMLGATVGTTSITGFQDVTVSSNFTGSGAVTINPQRDFTLSASTTLRSGGASALSILAQRDIITNAGSLIQSGATGSISLQAANNSTSGTGNLTLNGNLSIGTGALTLSSGINGTRPSWTLDTTTLVLQGATVGAVSIQGFLDFTLNRSLTSTGAIAILSNRDLNINTGMTLTGGATAAYSLRAANGSTGGTGNLNINGNMSVGTGAFTLLSGINGTRPTLTLSSSNLTYQGATVGAVSWQGFNVLTVSSAINSTSTITMSNNTSTVLGANVTSTGAHTYGNAASIAQGTTVALSSTNANITFSSTLNGTAGGAAENLSISAGTGTVTFTGIVGGSVSLGNLSVTADNLTLSAALNGTGTLTLQPVTAGRAININTAQADNNTANGFNLSTAEVGRIAATWSSVAIGNSTAGAFTNSLGTINWPISFTTGGNYTNATAISSNSTVFIQAGGDIILTQKIATTNTSANAITLVAGGNFTNNFGAGALVTGAGGRWLVYSTNPNNNTGIASLSNAFNRYTCTYSGVCPTLGTGNGFLYSYTPLLDVTISPQTYNYGDAIIPPTGYTLQTSGYLNATDLAEGVVGGVGNFSTTYVQGANAGTSFTITNNGSTFTSNLGYGFNYVSPTGLVVGTRAITVQVNDQTVTYGNALNANAYSVASGSFYGSDAAGLIFTSNATLSGSSNYNYSATPWSLSANGMNFTSGLASNYSVTYIAAPTGLTVLQRAMAVSALGGNRVYDGTSDDTVTLSDNRVAGDNLSITYSSATFADKNVGAAKTVSVSGINVTGTDVGNYTFNTSTTTTADITARSLTISASGVNKTYDGTTTDAVSLSDNRVAGDVLTLGYGSANFADKNVGTGKSVSVAGITLTGTDAGNYTYNTTASTSADITARSLAITATGIDKTYDGLVSDTVSLSDNRVAGDVLTLGYGSANFADKNVGTGKSVSVAGITLTGTDAGNYTYNTTASTSANITARALNITAIGVSKTYDGTTTNAITLSDNRVAGDVLTLGYGAATFVDKNVGTAKSISVTGISVSGTDAGNYTYNTTASTSADITARSLTVTASSVGKAYDGTTTDTVSLSDNRVAGDVLILGYGAANFADKNVGTGKAVSVSGISITGTDAGNYTYNTTASTSADITARSLTVNASGVSKTYDGTATDTVTLSDNRVAGDVLTLGYGSASFADKNVGTGKAVSVAGITVTGTDAGNYTYNTTASTSADITVRSLTVTASGVGKTYDGTTTDTVNLADNRVAGDVLTLGYGTANFADKNVGAGKAVSVAGITVTGADAGNYSYNTTATTSANITARALTVAVTGSNKTYDGTATASVSLSDNRVAGDVLTLGYGSAAFADKNAGTAKSVSVTGISVTGADAANYTYSTTASTSANIAARPLNITASATDKVYDGLTNVMINSITDDRITGDVLAIGYGSATFADKNVGTGKTVTLYGITVTGTDAGNYSFSTTMNAASTANIAPRSLNITALGINKVYDGSTSGNVSLSDNRILGDVLTLGYSTATFADKNVGAGKSVSVSGITATGTDAGNYTYNSAASTTATITARALTITASANDKAYDGLVSATATLSDNRVAGDVLTLGYGSATFADKEVGNGKTVNITGITLTGTDAGNYSYNTSAIAFAKILSQGDFANNNDGAGSGNAPSAPPVLNVSFDRRPILITQLPNTVKKGIQDPSLLANLDRIAEYLIFFDEWQKRQHHKIPTRNMIR